MPTTIAQPCVCETFIVWIEVLSETTQFFSPSLCLERTSSKSCEEVSRSFRWPVHASMLPSVSYLDNWRVKQFDISKDLLYCGESRLSDGSTSEIDRLSMARTNTSSKLSCRNWPNSSEFIRWNRIQNVKNRLSTWRAVSMVSSVTSASLFSLKILLQSIHFIHSIPPADVLQIRKSCSFSWILLDERFQSLRDYFKNWKSFKERWFKFIRIGGKGGKIVGMQLRSFLFLLFCPFRVSHK